MGFHPTHCGEMAEWSIAPVLKTGRLARVSGVQIPLSPPLLQPIPLPFKSAFLSTGSSSTTSYLSLSAIHGLARVGDPGLKSALVRSMGSWWGKWRRGRRVCYRRWGSQICQGSSVSCAGKFAQTEDLHEVRRNRGKGEMRNPRSPSPCLLWHTSFTPGIKIEGFDGSIKG